MEYRSIVAFEYQNKKFNSFNRIYQFFTAKLHRQGALPIESRKTTKNSPKNKASEKRKKKSGSRCSTKRKYLSLAFRWPHCTHLFSSFFFCFVPLIVRSYRQLIPPRARERLPRYQKLTRERKGTWPSVYRSPRGINYGLRANAASQLKCKI